MSSARPLAFLLGRSILNGVKRAVTSPKRLIALTVFGLYYFQLFIGRFSGGVRTSRFPAGTPRFDLPPTATIDAVVFGLIGAMSLVLMTSILSYRGGFKSADVDVLFPTPVSPRVVLLFRIARDTLATLLLPLVVGVIGYQNGRSALAPFFRHYPKQGGDIFRALIVAYLLVALVWVCAGYATSLFVNRSDFQSDRNRKIVNSGIGVIIVGLALYATYRMRLDLSFATYVDMAHNPVVRIVLAPVTLATWLVMGSFEGNVGLALAGLLGLAAMVALALAVAMTQVGWMYDQAAVRGFDTQANMVALQRKGDLMGMQAERARQGKVKHGRLARRIAALRVRGPMALLWKEAILQARGSLSGMVALGFIFLCATTSMMWVTSNQGETLRRTSVAAGWTLLGMQGFMVYILCMANSQGGFIEFLRRVDVQKPLPFTPAATVFWEVVAKAVAPSVLGLLAAVVGVAMNARTWPYAIAGVVLTPAFAILLSAVVLLVIVLFPDIDDPTQRMFRGLMLMLGIAICLLPGAAILLLGTFALHLSPILVAPVAVAVNLGIALGLSSVAGNLYASYNPSE